MLGIERRPSRTADRGPPGELRQEVGSGCKGSAWRGRPRTGGFECSGNVEACWVSTQVGWGGRQKFGRWPGRALEPSRGHQSRAGLARRAHGRRCEADLQWGGVRGAGRHARGPSCLLQTEGRLLGLLTSPEVTMAWHGDTPTAGCPVTLGEKAWEQEAGPQGLPTPLPHPQPSGSPDPELLTWAPAGANLPRHCASCQPPPSPQSDQQVRSTLHVGSPGPRPLR